MTVRRSFALGGLVAALTLVAPTAAAVAGTPGTSTLYVLQARGGTLQGDTLVLRGVDPKVTTFRDRPARLGGAVAVRTFAARWSRAFGDDPPNAALELVDAPAGRDVRLVELGRPRYDARRRTLAYRVRPLRGDAGDALAPFGRRADRRVAQRFGRSALYVDGGSASTVVPLTITWQAFLNQTMSIALTNATLEYTNNADGTVGYGHVNDMSGEAGSLTLTSTSWSASAGPLLPSGGTVIANLVPDPFATTLTGTVTMPTGPSGIYLRMQVGSGPVKRFFESGSFSVPLPGS